MKQGLEALKLFDRRGSLDIANERFETVLKHDANNAAAVAGLAMTYLFRYASDGQDEVWLAKASAAAQRAMSLNDQIALSHVAYGRVLSSQGKHEEALQAYVRAKNLDPSNIFVDFYSFESLKALGRLEEALTLAQQASQRFPQERVFMDDIGAVYFQKGEYVKAEQAFRQSIAVQPDAVFSYANLSAVLNRLGKSDEALQVLQQGLQIRPSATLYTNLGDALFKRGDYIAAASAFEQAVSPTKGNPSRYNYWANLADTLLWIPGRKQEAKESYQKAIDLLLPKITQAPKDIAFNSRLGLYFSRVGNHSQAEEFTRKALELAPKNSDVHFRAGLAYELLGNRKLALEMLAKAKQLGYPAKFIEAEPDLLSLRRDPAYLK